MLPGWRVFYFVDDSILPQIAECGGELRCVESRNVQYARFAERAGSEAILNACSSVGELVGKERQVVTIPVVRIDEAMAEVAVRRARKIGVIESLKRVLERMDG